jgi:hypothetical protein
MQRSTFLIGTTALLAFAALMLVGCGVGSGGPASERGVSLASRRATPTACLQELFRVSGCDRLS